MATVPTTPVVHLTDLYCPPQDPDDTLDLLTLHALPELEIRAVVLDPTRRFLRARRDGGYDIAREPGLVTVLQLQHLTGTAYPVAAGPVDPLRDASDDCRDRTLGEQAGVELILRVLRESDRPVVVSVVSSLRPLVAAYNRDPELCRERIDRVLVNAGSAAGEEREWNVALDPVAYTALWRTALRVDWYPCAGAGGSFAREEHSTYWSADLRTLVAGLPAPLSAWLHYSFGAGARGDPLRSLHELGEGEAWRMVSEGTRNMWSTASLVQAAGRTLRRTDDGWRFVPREGDEDGAFGLEAAEEPQVRRFRRPLALDHDAAMTEALHDLLSRLPVDAPAG
ncbi:MAG TPA: hypothetical protein VF053_06770 [Streptosporangiales bacterium]